MNAPDDRRIVLLVDDDGDFLFQQRLQLETAGFRVLSAAGAGDAERLLEQQRPDLAVVDVMMEHPDAGFTLCHHIRKRDPSIPVILVTSVNSESGMDFDAATDEERTALLDGAGLLFDFVDSVSRAFSDAYDQATRAGAPSPDERAAQGLLVRLERNETHLPEDYQLAGRIGFDLAGPWRPFLVTMPGRSPSDHSRLARRLRDQRVLAASAGRRVTAAALERPHWRELDDGPNSIIAESGLVPAEEFGAALGNLRALVEVAAESGLTGPVNLDDHLAEVLLHRSPTIAARLSARVFGPLDADDAELARTLESLIEHDFDRGRTAAALPVHRNTLTNRLHRIRSMTGVDVDRADGTALVWLAWLERCRDGSGSRTAARPPT